EDSVYVEAGGLMSYGPDYQAVFEKAAIFVDKILKGAKPAGLPIEQPTKFELVINLKTAKVLGLEVPDKLLGLGARGSEENAASSSRFSARRPRGRSRRAQIHCSTRCGGCRTSTR